MIVSDRIYIYCSIWKSSVQISWLFNNKLDQLIDAWLKLFISFRMFIFKKKIIKTLQNIRFKKGNLEVKWKNVNETHKKDSQKWTHKKRFTNMRLTKMRLTKISQKNETHKNYSQKLFKKLRLTIFIQWYSKKLKIHSQKWI